MNFYKSQDDALKKTKILVLYFGIAIFGTIVMIFSLISLGRMFIANNSKTAEAGQSALSTFFDLKLFAIVGVLTSLTILAGWFYKRLQIGSGGSAVAQAMGARPVFTDTQDPDEKQLINVVEEMAIASGMPVPEVWLLEKDSGINAFAAGTEPGNAVIGVTRGTMQRLTRAELQGVIAHEFSHILNGDMKLNIRLMCMLHGLLLLTIIGYTILRLAVYSGSGRRSSKEEGGAKAAMLGIAVILIIAGTVGAFFAAMIQAAISRQREYLADAYAVEFTMDPDGIGGALQKIGGTSHRATVTSPVASEMEHMFFASSGMFRYGFASHPPLEERIGIIKPDWDGSYKDSSERSLGELVDMQQQTTAQSGMDRLMPHAVVAGAVLQELGETSSIKAYHGHKILQSLDESWKAACHDKYKAQLMIFGMLVAEDGELHQNEVQHLNQSIGQSMTAIVLEWRNQLANCKSSQQIALIDLCIPTLRKLSRDEYSKFIDLTQWLIKSDNSVNLFEFMLQKVLQRHLDAHFENKRKTVIKYPTLESLRNELEVLLSTVAGVGASSREMLDEAFASGNEMLSDYGMSEVRLLSPDQCGIPAVDNALKKIEQSSPMTKKQLLLVCGKVVMHDGVVTDREVELIRATADAIGCSVPPFVSDVA